MNRIFVLILLGAASACQKKETAPASSQAGVSTQRQIDYGPRIGVAVGTEARSCVAIQNATLQPGAPLTLVTPASPQSFTEVQVTGRSSSACPISQEVDPAMNSYDIKPSSGTLQKLVPFIAVVGPAAQFSMENINVQANLDGDGTADTFTACGADDGIHLAAWKGRPLIGAPIWKGYYYEAGNPGTLPACAATR